MSTKKYSSLILVILLVTVIFASCDGEISSYECYKEDNWEIAYSQKLNNAVAGEYIWSGKPDDMDIIIPDTFNGAPVTAWGGLVYTSKGIVGNITYSLFADLNWFSQFIEKANTREDVEAIIMSNFPTAENVEINDLTFNLHFGPNLREFEYAQDFEPLKHFFYHINDDGRVVVYVQCFNVIVHKDNPTYYSDDLGRLFYKETNKLVPHIIYHNRDTFPEGSLPTE